MKENFNDRPVQAMAVVGWWTGYKIGGVIALNNSAEYFKKWGLKIIGS